MSDVEQRLVAALEAAAGRAPEPAAGALAAGARRRGRVRRQRRVLVAVVALVLVGSGVLWGARGGETPVADPPRPAPAWQTIRQGQVEVEVPGDWRRIRCGDRDLWAPPDGACADRTGVVLLPAATVDISGVPGAVHHAEVDDKWTGNVVVGGLVVDVTDPDRDLVRRVLASARSVGGPGEHAVSYGGVGLVVPGEWSRKDCGGSVQITPGPACAGPTTGEEGVWFLDDATFQPATDEGDVTRSERDGQVRWGGFMRHGRHAVFVVRRDRDRAATLLAQVR